MNRAAVAANRGADLEQIEALTQASEAFAAAGKTQSSRDALRLRAEAYLAYGYQERAIEELNTLVELEAGNSILKTKALSSLGAAYFVAGRLDKAQVHLNQAVELARETNQPEILGTALQNLGNVLTKQKRYQKARSTYQEIIALARTQDNAMMLVRSQILGARTEKEAGNPGSMRQLLSDAYSALSRQPKSVGKAAGLLNIARVLGIESDLKNLTGADLNLASQALIEAREAANTIDNPSLSAYATGYLAKIYRSQGRLNDALVLTGQAIMYAQQANAPESLYLWEWQAGRLYYAKGDLSEAIDAYRRATANLKQIEGDLLEAAKRQDLPYRKVAGPLYQEFAALLLEQSGSEGKAIKVEDTLKEAREAIENLKTVELQDYFLDECVTATQSKAIGVELAATTRRSSENTAIFYPILLKNRSELLLTLPDGTLKQYTVNQPYDSVAAVVKELRRGLYPVPDPKEKGSFHTPPLAASLAPAKQLYQWLIQPIEQELENHDIDTLVVVPDADLLTIPFGALHNGQHYLIEDYAIAVIPGLTLTEAAPLSRWELQGLVAGLTIAESKELELPGVKREMVAIEDTLGKGRVTLLKDKNFSVQNLQNTLNERPYSIVHIASHAQFGATPDETFIMVYKDSLSIDDLEDLMQLRRFSEEPIELLVLSACQTAKGDVRAALGLSGLAIKAGARSAVGALWSSFDEETADFIEAFYNSLQQNPAITKAKALQTAQLALIQDDKQKGTDHPTYWAPFILIGNWL